MTADPARSRWDDLLALALTHMESVGVGRRDWTWGGGTVLMLRHRHRLSRDVDLFLNDVQTLAYLSPRLNDSVASTVDSYSEQANHLRCVVNGLGEIDYLAVAPVIDFEPETMDLPEHGIVQVMSDREILAQKIHYRATALKGRDLFDFATVTHVRPELLLDAKLHGVATGKRAVLEKSLNQRDSLENDYAAVEPFDSRMERMSFKDATNRMLAWLQAPSPAKTVNERGGSGTTEWKPPEPSPSRDPMDPFRK